MTVVINGTTGVTSGSGQFDSASTFGFKNRIINGAMMIDQRNDGANVSISSTSKLVTDRFNVRLGTGSGHIAAKSTDAPAGFKNSLAITIGTGGTPAAPDGFNYITHWIEGYNASDLGFGASGASTITISFWVKCSLTGQFGASFANYSTNRTYPFTFTINSANTWEQKTVTIAGDTTGTWSTDNSGWGGIIIDLGNGSNYLGSANAWAGADYRGATGDVKLVSTSGATFKITGVQLEKGSTATSFDYRPYGTELALCQRYCINYNSANANGAFYRYCYGECTTAVGFQAQIQLPVTMRITPSVTTTGTSANYAVYSRATVTALNAAPTIGGTDCSPQTVMMNTTVASGLTAGSAGALLSNNNQTSYLLFTAEL